MGILQELVMTISWPNMEKKVMRPMMNMTQTKVTESKPQDKLMTKDTSLKAQKSSSSFCLKILKMENTTVQYAMNILMQVGQMPEIMLNPSIFQIVLFTIVINVMRCSKMPLDSIIISPGNINM